jgi:ribonuclease D
MAPQWITAPPQLQDLAASLTGSRLVALDSESDSIHHYHEKVCLIQLATEKGEVYLIDPLALKNLDALAPLMADPAIEKVFHGADYDVATLRRDFGFTFRNLFDTMVASRFLNLAEVGLQASLEREFARKISKGPQTADWSRRPLTEDLVRYAAGDVEHLAPLRDRLVARLKEIGREAWVREECAAIANAPAAATLREPADFMKAKGARDLDLRSLGVLKELFTVREELAKKLDRPRFKVIGDESLLLLAERKPRSEQAIGRIPRCAYVRRYAAEVLDAIRRGEELKESELPQIPAPKRTQLPFDVRKRMERLKVWRNVAVERLKLEAGLLLPQRLIDVLAKAAPTTAEQLSGVDGLRQWRVQAMGDELLGILSPRAPASTS